MASLPSYYEVGPVQTKPDGSLFVECKVKWWGWFVIAYEAGLFWQYVWLRLKRAVSMSANRQLPGHRTPPPPPQKQV